MGYRPLFLSFFVQLPSKSFVVSWGYKHKMTYFWWVDTQIQIRGRMLTRNPKSDVNPFRRPWTTIINQCKYTRFLYRLRYRPQKLVLTEVGDPLQTVICLCKDQQCPTSNDDRRPLTRSLWRFGGCCVSCRRMLSFTRLGFTVITTPSLWDDVYSKWSLPLLTSKGETKDIILSIHLYFLFYQCI